MAAHYRPVLSCYLLSSSVLHFITVNVRNVCGNANQGNPYERVRNGWRGTSPGPKRGIISLVPAAPALARRSRAACAGLTQPRWSVQRGGPGAPPHGQADPRSVQAVRTPRFGAFGGRGSHRGCCSCRCSIAPSAQSQVQIQRVALCQTASNRNTTSNRRLAGLRRRSSP
jgi:hypothetical protein